VPTVSIVVSLTDFVSPLATICRKMSPESTDEIADSAQLDRELSAAVRTNLFRDSGNAYGCVVALVLRRAQAASASFLKSRSASNLLS
jgi:hypothetical protein